MIEIKHSKQAANSVIDDDYDTIDRLESIAGSIRIEDDSMCAAFGYRRINFLRHDYFMLYRLEGNTAIIDRMFHQREDYRNKI